MREDEAVARAAKPSMERIARDRERGSPEIRRLLDDIAEHFLDPGYGLQDLIRVCGDNVDQKLAAFASQVGRPVTYIAEVRLATAMLLLLKTDWSVARISEQVGYLEPSRFSNACKRRFDMTPNEYRSAAWRDGAAAALLPAPSGRQKGPPEELCFSGEVPSPVPEEERSRIARRMAEQAAAYLGRHTPDSQLELARNQLFFGGSQLLEHVSRVSREVGRRDRELGLRMAELALATVEGSRPLLGKGYADLHALALARLANAMRLAGDLGGADAVFQRMEDDPAWPNTTHSGEIEVEIIALKGSLRLFQRRFPEARELLGAAIELAERINDVSEQVNARLQRAAVGRYEGRPNAMIPDLRAVAGLLADQEEPDRLQMLGVFQELTLAYVETRQIQQAEAQLPQAKALCEELGHGPSAHQLEWIAGLIAKARKEPIEAERLFRQAKAGFNEIGDNVSGAIAALEIAMLCHAEGRSEEVLALMTTEVIPVLETVELHCEELGAVALLRKAAAEKNLSLAVLDGVRTALRAIRWDAASMWQEGRGAAPFAGTSFHSAGGA